MAFDYPQRITAKKILRSNKDEIDVLLDIMGICGVLSSKEAPCYCELFCNLYERGPEENTNDCEYPVNRWKASDGINEEWLEKVFQITFSS